MSDDSPGERGPRMTTLLRHLGEAAERDAAARARFLSGLQRVLSGPSHDVPALLEATIAAVPALDSAALVVGEEDGWRMAAALGVTGVAGSLPAPLIAEGILAEALRRGEPIESAAAAVPRALLPPGSRAALVVPLANRAGAVIGIAVFGSRSEHQLAAEDIALTRAAADRMARAMEVEQLASRVAQAEETARRTAGFRDQIFAIVGHDLRNPLGAIVMSAVLLQKKGGLSGWQAKTVERVRGSAARMGRIIDDLLSYTRTRLGSGIPVERGRADLGDVTRKMVEELRAAHPGTAVEITAVGDLSGEWDAGRLEQVISNLVSNAIDHGEDDQPVSVRLQGDGDEVELAVENRGEMPQEALEHAFEAFHRGPENTGKKASGLGLGLFIAREIVRRHGGEIWAAAEGGTTRVLMRLPRSARAPSHAAGP